MSNYNRLFGDISSNNPSFDAKAYKAAGHVLIAIKATESTNYVNPNHRGWTLAAALQHLSVLHYHFGRPDLGNSPVAEAAHFLSTVKPLTGGRDYLCLDLERKVPAGWSHDPTWSAAFDRYIQEHSRFHTVLYANKSTLEISDEWLVGSKKRVWDADWSTLPNYVPKGYTLFARQQSGDGVGPLPHTLTGIGGIVDVDLLSTPVFDAVTSHLP